MKTAISYIVVVPLFAAWVLLVSVCAVLWVTGAALRYVKDKLTEQIEGTK